MNHTDVLIVGAGPAGLAAALELARFGISFRIIDKKIEPTKTSNALGIHARTLELLDSDVRDALLAKGKVATRAAFYTAEKNLATLDLSQIDSAYKMMLFLPQSQTEQVFIEALKARQIAVEWQKTLKNIEQNENEVSARVLTTQGEEIICAKWLLAFDGYHSTARELLKMSYDGEDLPLRFVMMDTTLDITPAIAETRIYLGELPVIIFPLPSGVRIIINIPEKNKALSERTPDENFFTEICARYFKTPFKIHRPTWTSHFYIHQRLIKQYRVARVFFGGDAAHAHSPAGGHGMNTGIQDAINLGWKLSLYLKGFANEACLASYESERRAIAKQVIAETNKQTRLMLAKNPLLKALRNFMLSHVLSCACIRKILSQAATELSFHYRHSPLAMSSKHMAKLKSGDRVPDLSAHLQQKTCLPSLSRSQHTLLIFDGGHACPLPLQKIQAEMLHCIRIPATESALYRLFGFQASQGYALIRPDHYFAYVGKQSSKINTYFMLYTALT